jgi:hypothetical protein
MLLMVVAFGFAFRFGLLALVKAFVVVGCIMSPVYCRVASRGLGIAAVELLQVLRTPLACIVAFGLAATAARYASATQAWSPLLVIAAACAAGLAAYLLALGWLAPRLLRNLVCEVRDRSGVRRWFAPNLVEGRR